MIFRQNAEIWSRFLLFLVSALGAACSWAGPFAPAAGLPGSTAVAATDSRIAGWASGHAHPIVRGPVDIAFPSGAVTTYGSDSDALGPADASWSNPFPVVSLGDGGYATLTFPLPIADLPGPDLAVFENGFNSTFLELAFVEVSSNGIDFVRFPSESLTPASPQIDGFGSSIGLDPTNIDNLAGKYEAGYGTPLDLAVLDGVDPNLDVSSVTHVRVVDVIGSIATSVATLDSMGRVINDPYPTNYPTGGFDLDAVAVLWPFDETYGDWADRNFLPAEAAMSGFEFDYDRDGIKNGLEAAFLRDPKRVDGEGVVTATRSGNEVEFRFLRVPWMPEFTYELEVSEGLAAWTVVARSENGGVTQNLGALSVTEFAVAGGRKVCVRVSAEDACFSRVRVSR